MSLKCNISWSLIGNVIYAGCQWAMITMLAKVTDAQTVGQFALGLSITAPVFAFSNLQLREVQVTDARGVYNFSTYLGFRIISSLFALVVIAIIAIYSQDTIETTFIILIIGLAKAIESISDIFYGYIQKKEQMRMIATSMIIKGVLSLVVFVVAVFQYKSMVAGGLSLVASYLLILIFFDVRNVSSLLVNKSVAQYVRPIFIWHDFKKLFWLAFPLGIVISLNSLNLNIPRYLIVDFYGEEALGYYSAIAYLLVAGSTVVSAIGQSSLPRLSKFYQNDHVNYKRLLFKIFGLSAAVGMLGVVISFLLGEYLLTILYTEKYSDYADVLIWTMIGAMALYCSSIIGCGISAARSFKLQSLVSIFVTGVILVVSYLLVPVMGMIGGAIALVIGFTFKLVLQTMQLAYLLKNNRNFSVKRLDYTKYI